MSVIRVGSVDVQLDANPKKKKVNETGTATVELVCRNYSVCQVDVRLRDLASLDPRMVKSLFLCECLTREHRVQVGHAAAA